MQVLLQVAVLQGQAVATQQLGQHVGPAREHQQAQRQSHQQAHQRFSALAAVEPVRHHQHRAGSLSRPGPLL